VIAFLLPWPDRVCSISGCSHPHYGKGFCSAHYDRWRRHGDPLKGGAISWKPVSCSVEGCSDPVIASGFCNAHYKRLRRHGEPAGGGTPHGDPMKFLMDVIIPIEDLSCIEWPFSRDKKGYGRVFEGGHMRGAHRVVCEIAHGQAPTQRHEAAHSCGNGHLGCVNPNHLSWKTRKGNHADKLIHGTHNRGERHQMAKLTEASVRHIKELRGKKSLGEIAALYAISKPTVCNIHKGKTWGWLA